MTRGSIVIALTLQDVDEGANVTLLIIEMHNDVGHPLFLFLLAFPSMLSN